MGRDDTGEGLLGKGRDVICTNSALSELNNQMVPKMGGKMKMMGRMLDASGRRGGGDVGTSNLQV